MIWHYELAWRCAMIPSSLQRCCLLLPTSRPSVLRLRSLRSQPLKYMYLLAARAWHSLALQQRLLTHCCPESLRSYLLNTGEDSEG